jgi:hypothetical protein
MPRASAPLAAFVCTAAVAAAGVARADERTIIKQPGDHPSYIFEAEPHIALGYTGPFDGAFFVAGFRGAVNIANGFIPSINNSVAIGFGIDIATDGTIFAPIVLQWNFWLSTHWSVFAEPGFAITSGDQNVYPAFFAGGRFHFTDRIALTIRVGYPDVTLGVSFLL